MFGFLFKVFKEVLRRISIFLFGHSVKEQVKKCSKCTANIQLDSFRIVEENERREDSTMRFVRENEAKLDAILKEKMPNDVPVC